MSPLLLLMLLVLPVICASLSWTALTSLPSSNLLIASTIREGIIRSSDQGKTWTATSAPVMPWNSLTASSDGSLLLATASKHGVFLSFNQGRDWKKATSSSLPSLSWKTAAASATGDLLVLVSSEGPVYRSLDKGDSWSLVSLEEANANGGAGWQALGLSPDGRVALLAGLGGEGILASSNSAASFATTSSSLTGGSFVALVGDGKGSRWFAASLGEGIYRSEDEGKTWEKTSAPDHLLYQTIACNPSATSTISSCSRLVAATAGDSLYSSRDGGDTWKKSNAPTRNWLAVHWESDSRVFALSADQENRLYRSDDSGITWTTSAATLTTTRQNNPTSPDDTETEGKKKRLDSLRAFVSRPVEPAAIQLEVVAPTGQPSSQPSSQPSAAPSKHTAAPSLAPTTAPSITPTTAPTASPSLTPTASPTISQQPTVSPTNQNSPILTVNANYQLDLVPASSLDTQAQDVLSQTISQVTTPTPTSVDILSIDSSTGRRLTASLLSTKNNFTVHAQLTYNLVDFPGNSVSNLTTAVTNSVAKSVSSGLFTTTMQNNAVSAGVTVLYPPAYVPGVTTTTSVDRPGGNDDDNLSDGDIAAIVISSFIGFCGLLAIIYFYFIRKRDDSSSGPLFTVPGRYSKASHSDMVTDDKAIVL